MLTTLLLSRIQFAVTITFHILFPAFSIGLAWIILGFEILWVVTANELHYKTCRFYSKLLALTFGMGIVSGLAMEFQLGTNWSNFAEMVGPVLGVLFVAEALSAFFIEATFLGLMLFGWERLPQKVHLLSTFMVCIGVTISAFWIMAANSWMHTPSGIIMKNHHFVVINWWQVIFNPSTVSRFLHMLLASLIATSTILLGISAHYLLRSRELAYARLNTKTMIYMLAILLPLQIVLGDKVGLTVHQYQPIKTAAIEGLWHTQKGAPLLLFAKIDQIHQRNNFSIKIPHLASLINTHQWNGKLVGLDQSPKQQQPRVALVFYSFRIMVAIGLGLLSYSLYALYLLKKQRYLTQEIMLKLARYNSMSGLIALVCGWYTAECGRQPWVVQGYLTTIHAANAVPPHKVIIGFIIIILVYGILFGCCYLSYLFKLIRHGPSSIPSYIPNIISRKKRAQVNSMKIRSNYATLPCTHMANYS